MSRNRDDAAQMLYDVAKLAYLQGSETSETTLRMHPETWQALQLAAADMGPLTMMPGPFYKQEIAGLPVIVDEGIAPGRIIRRAELSIDIHLEYLR